MTMKDPCTLSASAPGYRSPSVPCWIARVEAIDVFDASKKLTVDSLQFNLIPPPGQTCTCTLLDLTKKLVFSGH